MREARVSPVDPLLAPVPGADHREVAGVTLDIVKAGAGRVKRVVYPPGFRWSSDMKHVSGTALCLHAHVGWIVRGHVQIQYGDGCVASFSAPAAVVIDGQFRMASPALGNFPFLFRVLQGDGFGERHLEGSRQTFEQRNNHGLTLDK